MAVIEAARDLAGLKRRTTEIGHPKHPVIA